MLPIALTAQIAEWANDRSNHARICSQISASFGDANNKNGSRAISDCNGGNPEARSMTTARLLGIPSLELLRRSSTPRERRERGILSLSSAAAGWFRALDPCAERRRPLPHTLAPLSHRPTAPRPPAAGCWGGGGERACAVRGGGLAPADSGLCRLREQVPRAHARAHACTHARTHTRTHARARARSRPRTQALGL